MLDIKKQSHRRFNPLTGEWVLVSPHRTARPWQGSVEKSQAEDLPAYDPQCYLCPGNSRAGDAHNPIYTETFVFENDFAALSAHHTEATSNIDGLLIAESESGICRVICFTPRHDLTLARMKVEEILRVIRLWRDQYVELGKLEYINSVQIFENRGAMMGASNPHPHCQIWANRTVPNHLAVETQSAVRYYEKHNQTLLADYLKLEMKMNERIVCRNEHFVALVPFWAIYPFETMIISQRAVSALDQLNEAEMFALSEILKELTTRYDNLFETSFPYTMGFHQRPTDGKNHESFHLHAHFYPPLLRSATVKKFMVGYELLAMPQRDITPEEAAEKLRQVSAFHYLGEPRKASDIVTTSFALNQSLPSPKA